MNSTISTICATTAPSETRVVDRTPNQLTAVVNAASSTTHTARSIPGSNSPSATAMTT